LLSCEQEEITVHQDNDTTFETSSSQSDLKRDDVLVVVDDTESSKLAVSYTGRMLAGCADTYIHLVCIAARIPARLLEFGGSERPDKEERLDAELHRRQLRWTDLAEQTPDAILDAAADVLRRAGVEPDRISTSISSPLDLRADAEEILLLAHDEGCQTIVVGHHLSNDDGEKLANALIRSPGHTIWAVDSSL
jgi:nucleotide-binding universal stress UspA family protein